MNELESFFHDSNTIDAFLISKRENILYLTGFQGSFGYALVLKSGETFLITDSRYREVAQNLAKISSFEFVLFDKNFAETIREKIPKDCQKIAMEDSATLSQKKYWDDVFPKKEIVPHTKIIEKIREIKNTNELQKIQKACDRLNEIFDDVDFFRGILTAGVTEKAAAFALETKLRDGGTYELSFDIIVAFGENSALPHHFPGDRKLKNGDNILIDCGVKIDNYCSDMTRNFVLGKPSDEYVGYFEKLLKAQKATIKEFEIGKKLIDADLFCREILGDYAKLFTHSLGHGVGMEVHELPNFSPKESAIFAQNHVITCEPGIYIPGKFGIRIEDQIVITKDGPEILTKTSKELIIL